MKAIIDADSIIYGCSFQETIEEAMESFNDKLTELIADLREFCEVSDVIVCNGSKNNFRTALNASYKANRKQERPTLLSALHKEVKISYNSYYGDGVETDDVVATLWKREVDENGVDSVVIVANDKDYKQFPCWFFDAYYKRRELFKITPFESQYNFYEQMIIGDTADNVNYCKGYGRSYANEAFKGVESEFGLLKRTYGLYLKIYKSEAKSRFKECFDLLRLRTDIDDKIKRYE